MDVEAVDVVVNLHARHGSPAVVDRCREELPGARILASRSLDEAERFTRDHDSGRASLLVAAGGDGTALALINSLRRELLSLGILPLGTGNAWAHAIGSPPWRIALHRLAGWLPRGEPVPTQRFRLLEVTFPGTDAPDMLAHFAGTGWDAEIIDDFYQQRRGFGLLPRGLRGGLAGYLQGVLLHTIPRHLRAGAAAEVEITNTGSDALTVDDEGRAVPLVGGGHGQVLYRGPANVCAAGTAESWGFGFRAFPFARLVPDRFCLRVYAGRVTEAARNAARLWRGHHPMPKMHTFLVDRCRAVFSRPVPFQAGGELLGHRSEVAYTLADAQVDVVDWGSLKA